MASKKDKITIDDISIANFIFHIVHHDAEKAFLMDKTPIGTHERFFKERICEIVNGNQFLFLEGSPFLESLKEIDTNPYRFDSESRVLAERFHKPSDERDERIKAGAMIFIKAIIEGVSKYIIIKYDNENVLTYSLKDNEALLQEISNTFSKNRKALQKSAIIDMAGDEPSAILTDKSNSANITAFFKSFLGVRRKYTETDLTKKVKNAFMNTAKSFKETLDSRFLAQTTAIFSELIKNHEEFHAEDFVKAAFGASFKQEMLVVFDKSLKSEDILGEVFKFDKNFPEPQQIKLKTAEGIIIEYPISASDTIEIKHPNPDGLGGNKTIIIIETTKLYEENAKS